MSSSPYSYIKFLGEPSVVYLISSGDIERIVQELGKAELGDFDYLVIPLLCYILKEKGIRFNISWRRERGPTEFGIVVRLSSPTNEFRERSFEFFVWSMDYFENRDTLGKTLFGFLELATREERSEHTFISPFIDSEGNWKLGATGTEVKGDEIWGP